MKLIGIILLMVFGYLGSEWGLIWWQSIILGTIGGIGAILFWTND